MSFFSRKRGAEHNVSENIDRLDRSPFETIVRHESPRLAWKSLAQRFRLLPTVRWMTPGRCLSWMSIIGR